MTDPIKDGGPAFPPHPGSQHQGMSLRDWFAGQALAGMGHMTRDWVGTPIIEGVAVTAYQLADALLAAREGKK